MGDNFEFAGENQSTNSSKLLGLKPVFEAASKFDFSKFSQTDDFGKECLEIYDLNRSDFGRESLYFLRDDLGRDSLGIFNLSNIDTGRLSLGISNLKNCDLDDSKNIHLTKIEEDLDLIETNPFTNSPMFKSSRFLKDDFQLFSQSGDFGKESIGLLDFNQIDCGKQSLMFVPEDLPRESLGIINLNNIDIGKESLGCTKITNDFTSLNIKLFENNEMKNKISFQKNILSDESEVNLTNKNVPELVITKTSDNSNNTLSILNVGYPKLPFLSVASSVSPAYLSFNSASLESSVPSRISSESSNIDAMNDAFGSTSEYLKRMKTTFSVLSPKLNTSSFVDDVFSSPNKRESQCKDDMETKFQEAVFIEAKHIAEIIASGFAKESDMLDSTQEPEDFADVKIEEEFVKYDTETVFKNIDKLFVPNHQTVSNVDIDSSKQSNHSSGKSRSNSRNSSNSKSKEALEIIHSLSEILNSDNPKKEEGQNLLSYLAEILVSSGSTQSRSCILDDSGHSSIEDEPPITSEKPEVYEVLDLRKKSSSASDLHEPETEACTPLDLSLKSKSFASPKVLPPKYNRAPRKATISLNINHSSFSNCSVSSSESKSLSDLGKFKPKKTDEKLVASKKGPMKAVHPVDNMAKGNESHLKITPTRNDSRTSNYKMKKTSTPINDHSSLKPMAQSTPESKNSFPTSPLARPSPSVPNSSNKTLKNKITASTPPLARPSLSATKGTKLQQNYTDSGLKPRINNSLNSKIGVTSNLRKSSDELRQKPNVQKQITRSYSMESKPTNSTNTAGRPSVRRGSFSYAKTENTTTVLTENKNKFTRRPSLLKKIGKENIHK